METWCAGNAGTAGRAIASIIPPSRDSVGGLGNRTDCRRRARSRGQRPRQVALGRSRRSHRPAVSRGRQRSIGETRGRRKRSLGESMGRSSKRRGGGCAIHAPLRANTRENCEMDRETVAPSDDCGGRVPTLPMPFSSDTDIDRSARSATWSGRRATYLRKKRMPTNPAGAACRIYGRFCRFARRSNGRGGNAIRTVSHVVDCGRGGVETRKVGFSDLSGVLVPGQEMGNFPAMGVEKGRADRPPHSPYIVQDSLSNAPWLPTGEPHMRANDGGESQLTYRRYVGNHDVAVGKPPFIGCDLFPRGI